MDDRRGRIDVVTLLLFVVALLMTIVFLSFAFDVTALSRAVLDDLFGV